MLSTKEQLKQIRRCLDSWAQSEVPMEKNYMAEEAMKKIQNLESTINYITAR
jgi:hypothetical protein